MPDCSLKPRLLVVASIANDFRGALAAEFDLVDYLLEDTDASPAQLPQDTAVLVTRPMYGVPQPVLDALPNLRLVISQGAGLERIDTRALAARGITLAYTPHELTEDVADFAIGLAYALQRRIVEGDRFVRAGRWPTERFPFARRLTVRRAGVVGMGKIGRRIAEKANGLGMSVSYTSRSPRAELAYPFHETVVSLAADSDILFVACAGTAETRHLINAAVVAALGPLGLVINISRGSVVDEEALISALQDGRLGGAGLDVFVNEPEVDPRLLDLDNVVLSPHAASFTLEARKAMIDRLVSAARAHFELR